MKATAAMAYGATDVLNVAISEKEGTATEWGGSNGKLGILFAVVGIGSIVGPAMAEPFIDAKFPMAIQLSCVLAFAVLTIGYFGWSFETPFWSICLFSLVQAAGSTVIWINSTLLLQQFSSNAMMGRVLATDYAFGLLTEALSAYFSGILMDKKSLSETQVSAILACITLAATFFWTVYHFLGCGAGQFKANEDVDTEQQSKVEEVRMLEDEPLFKI